MKPIVAPGPHIRRIEVADLEAVTRLGNAIHLAHQERPEIFSSRVTLFGDGCWLATLPHDRSAPVGYALAHPYPAERIVPLDTVLTAPIAGEILYIHDIAVHPAARGQRLGAAFVAQLRHVAQAHHLHALALTALDGLAPYWAGLGFSPVDSQTLQPKLASYGPGACYMMCPI
jgi:GNAT superfamily N-acetyltransferase